MDARGMVENLGGFLMACFGSDEESGDNLAASQGVQRVQYIDMMTSILSLVFKMFYETLEKMLQRSLQQFTMSGVM